MLGLNIKILLLTIVFSLWFTASVSTQQQQKIQILKIRDLMTTTEFRKTGLTKLTTSELRELDQWVTNYTIRVAAALLSTPDVIESHIDGDFEGWEGETIFRLENGQIWQQATYSYHYHYAYRPKVLIYKTTGGYKMKVDEVSEEIYVERIK